MHHSSDLNSPREMDFFLYISFSQSSVCGMMADGGNIQEIVIAQNSKKKKKKKKSHYHNYLYLKT
jgi:hypothetical protein